MYHIPACLEPSKNRIAATTWCGVEFFFGKIGHGKTHDVIRRRLLTALKEGRHVYTNIDFGTPMQFEGVELLSVQNRMGMLLSDYLGKKVDHLIHLISSQWVLNTLSLEDTSDDFIGIPHGSRVILDEVQNIFPVDGYKTNPKGFFKLLTMCRHFDIDFCFLSQNHTLVDKRIISTCTDLIFIKNASFLSSMFQKTYRVMHYQSIWEREPYSSQVFQYDMDVFKLYKSSASVVKHKSSLIPPFLLWPMVLIALWFVTLLWKTHKASWFHKGGNGIVEHSLYDVIPATSTPLGGIVAPPPLQ